MTLNINTAMVVTKPITIQGGAAVRRPLSTKKGEFIDIEWWATTGTEINRTVLEDECFADLQMPTASLPSMLSHSKWYLFIDQCVASRSEKTTSATWGHFMFSHLHSWFRFCMSGCMLDHFSEKSANYGRLKQWKEDCHKAYRFLVHEKKCTHTQTVTIISLLWAQLLRLISNLKKISCDRTRSEEGKNNQKGKQGKFISNFTGSWKHSGHLPQTNNFAVLMKVTQMCQWGVGFSEQHYQGNEKEAV